MRQISVCLSVSVCLSISGWTVNREVGFKSPTGHKLGSRFLRHIPAPPSQHSYTEYHGLRCRREDETAMERTDNPPSYSVAKVVRKLTFNTRGCLRASLKLINMASELMSLS